MADHAPGGAFKRFYKSAGVAGAGRGWRIELDGRPVKTPAKRDLEAPTKALAEAIAREWDAQGETVDVRAMHLTRLANVALDRTPSTRDGMTAEVARFCETDLLCHLAEGPDVLRARQDAGWRPVRDWAGPALGVLLAPVDGIMAAPQPAASLAAARAHAAGLDDFRLTGLVFGCGLFGSALLALAVEQGELGACEAFQRSRIDETFQAERWGEDEEAMAATAARAEEAAGLGRWFAALDEGGRRPSRR